MSQSEKIKLIEEYVGSGIPGLLFAIIVEAGKDKDLDFLYGSVCYGICRHLNLRHIRVVKAVL